MHSAVECCFQIGQPLVELRTEKNDLEECHFCSVLSHRIGLEYRRLKHGLIFKLPFRASVCYQIKTFPKCSDIGVVLAVILSNIDRTNTAVFGIIIINGQFDKHTCSQIMAVQCCMVTIQGGYLQRIVRSRSYDALTCA